MLGQLESIVLIADVVISDASAGWELAYLDVPLNEATEKEILGFIIARTLNQLMQSKHHDEGFKVLFIKGEIHF